MKKLLIKFLCVVLSLSFGFSLSISAYAVLETKDDMKNKIIEALQAIECTKDKMGLSNVNFEDFEISEKPINAYIFANNSFEKKFEFYPLFIYGELTAFAIKIGSGSDSTFQVTTALVSNIINNSIAELSIALIYDDDCCYLYNGDELIILTEFSDKNTNRSDIAVNKENIDFSAIQINDIEQLELIGYTNQNIARTPVYYECDVDYVPQEPYDSICWAASISSITGYILDMEPSDAEFVAWFHYGDDFNRPLPRGDEVTVLGYYDITYLYSTTAPSGSVILNNIINGYPIFAGFESSSTGHAVVLYGINFISGIYYIMDPLFGFCSVTYKSGVGYAYTNPNSGNEFRFRYATCKYLTA